MVRRMTVLWKPIIYGGIATGMFMAPVVWEVHVRSRPRHVPVHSSVPHDRRGRHVRRRHVGSGFCVLKR